MKFVRVLARLALLSLAAAAFVDLTRIYGRSVRLPQPDAVWQAARRDLPAAPDAGRFLEPIGEGIVFAVYAVAGRIVLRLRLSPPSRSEGRPILLGLHREAKPAKSS